MTEPQINAGKPITCTFLQLVGATWALHQGDRAWMDSLMDVWKMGPPTPNTIIRNPHGYDPRKRQAGNYEARIVFPTTLAKWIMDCARAQGIDLDINQGFTVAMGREPIMKDSIQVVKR